MRTHIAAVLVLMGWISSAVYADSPARPFSYTKATEDGRFIFVMIAPTALEEELRLTREDLHQEVRDIRARYPRSGMYRQDNPREPLWTVDWYSTFNLAPDGAHLVRYGPWAWLNKDRTPDLDVEAVSFFAEGKLLRTYSVGDLVDPRAAQSFPQSASHYRWLKSDRWLNDHEYSLETRDDQRYVFDIRTGAILSHTRTRTDWHLVGWVALGGVLALLAIFTLRRRSRRQPRE